MAKFSCSLKFYSFPALQQSKTDEPVRNEEKNSKLQESFIIPPQLKRRASLSDGQSGIPGSKAGLDSSVPSREVRRGSKQSTDASPTRRERRGSNESNTSATAEGRQRRRSSTEFDLPNTAVERPRRKSAEEIRYAQEVQKRSAKTHLDQLKYSQGGTGSRSVVTAADWASMVRLIDKNAHLLFAPVTR